MTALEILGVPVHNVTYDQALTQVGSYLRDGSFHQIATVNPEFVVIAQSNPEFMSVLRHTHLNVADGIGIIWAARSYGSPLAERVTGQELTERICALAAEQGVSLFLLGAKPGIAEQAAGALQARHPGLIVSGCCSGSPSDAEAKEILLQIARSNARILLVAYGPPKQELWIARHAARLPVSVALGVGGTLDTLAGVSPRAPHWMQEKGLEWLFRLAREPRRWRRQTSIPYFIWLVLRDRSRRTQDHTATQ